MRGASDRAAARRADPASASDSGRDPPHPTVAALPAPPGPMHALPCRRTGLVRRRTAEPADRFSNVRPLRHAAIGEAWRHSGNDEAARRWNAMRSFSDAAQSCHLARWTGTSGRSAIQGTRSASATMAPCIASLSSTPAACDRGDDGSRIAARVDQPHPGCDGGRVPCTAAETFEVRHEADRPPDCVCGDGVATSAASETDIWQQHRRVAEAEAFGQTEQAACERPADPVNDPAGIERR